jgi:mannose-1-phosphate guanylyltransferase
VAGFAKGLSQAVRALLGKRSLYQMTLKRLSGETMGQPLVITAEQFRFLATEHALATGMSGARMG